MADTINLPDSEIRIGVLGATSLVGTCLLPKLCEAGAEVKGFSRSNVGPSSSKVEWRKLAPTSLTILTGVPIRHWICLVPIWVLPDYFELFEGQGAKRVVALSSTSIFTKQDSNDLQEQSNALRLVNAEHRFRAWAQASGVEWVILRPTLIYDLEKDKNIAEIAQFITRFGFFPVFGKANGLRQPVHANDVAAACIAALQRTAAADQAYNISGGETLTYRNMVGRVFLSRGRRPILLRVPLWAFRVAIALVRYLPRYKLWSAAMAERMCRDMVFDHSGATRDLGFKPRSFVLEKKNCG